MDVWIIVNPILKVLLYAASFVSVGTVLFSLHFAKHLSVAQRAYCDYLAFKAALVGAVTSLCMIFSVAGNLGGDIVSLHASSCHDYVVYIMAFFNSKLNE